MRSIHVSPDGSQVVAANNKGRCYVWKLAPDSKFEPLTHIDAHKSYILKALYSPDAKYDLGRHLPQALHRSNASALHAGSWPHARPTRLSSFGAPRTTSSSRPSRYRRMSALFLSI